MIVRLAQLLFLSFFCASVHAAPPAKVLRVLLSGPEASLDPALATDLPSLSINENIFDAPLRYDYLARPLALQANTLKAMPSISSDGKSYLMQLRPGIFFTPDAAFKGQRRELTAADYAYSIKRLYDPALKSPWLFLFEGKLLGDEKLRSVPFDVDTAIVGLQVLDRYTLRITLKQADSNFLFLLATPASAAVAREVVQAYGAQLGNHAVGTGPFMLGQWQRNARIQLLANPAYAARFSSVAAPEDQRTRQILKNLQGQRLPRVDSIEIKIVEEPQARVLGFLSDEFDYLEQLPPALSEMLLSADALKPELKSELAKKGVQLGLSAPLQTYYMWMNMEDAVLGGYTPERIALRRAIALSYDSAEDIGMLEKGLALAAHSPLPPDVLGYDKNYRSPLVHDLKLANALLDKFGYSRGADGYRNLPDGQPLSLTMHSLASGVGRVRDELWRKNMQALAIRISFKTDKHAEIIKAARLGKVQMTEANWIADIPDGENFYQLLYGLNRGRANYARFDLPAFNALYAQSRTLSDGPQRRRLYHAMAQLLHAYTPWVLRIHPLSADLWQPWLKNYQRHPVSLTTWRYLDLESR